MYIPTFQNVIIKPYILGERTHAGLIIPDTLKNTLTHFGEVVAVGKGSDKTPMLFKVGDVVLVPPKKNQMYKEDGVDYLVVNQFDLMMSKTDKGFRARIAWVLIEPEREKHPLFELPVDSYKKIGIVKSVGESCEDGIEEGMKVFYDGAATLLHKEGNTIYELVNYLDIKAIV